MLVWTSIYYFIFVMKRVKDKLQSQSYEDSQRLETTNIKLQRGILISYVILISIPEIVINDLKINNDN